MSRASVRVAVTGAAGQIGYALLFRIAAGNMFGPDVDVHLRLLELEQALPALKGVVMELDDCAFPRLKSIVQTADVNEVFKDVDWAILVGSVPRKEGMERNELLKINGQVFIAQGKAISDHAKPTCKILVVGNPCNTNAYIAKSVCKKISEKNFFAMTMLDQNRGLTQLAQKVKTDVVNVKNLAVWGNHSSTQYPDFYHATINGKPALELIDEQWFKTTFLETVQKRGAAIIKARGLSSAASAANAVIDTVKNIIAPTPKGEFFSVAVSSDGSYGIDKGLMFSYPIRSNGKNWEVVQGIKHNVFALERIQATHEELRKEREDVTALLT